MHMPKLDTIDMSQAVESKQPPKEEAPEAKRTGPLTAMERAMMRAEAEAFARKRKRKATV